MRGRDLQARFPATRVAASAALDLAALCAAYSFRLRADEVFSHVTAARLWGIPLETEWTPGEPLHVSVPAPGRAARGRGIRGHQITRGGVQRGEVGGVPVIDPVTAWLQLGSLLSPPGLVAAGDHLVRVPPLGDDLRRPFTTVEALTERARSVSGRGILAARRAAGPVREGSDSPQESRVRLALLAAGLPEPELNPVIRDAEGRFVARVDMLYRGARVVVEYDGDQHRTDRHQYDRDIRRIDALYALGWTVVRIRQPQMRHGAQEAVALVRAALARRGAIELPPSALKRPE